ncbi:TonB-dependent receptor [Sphingobium sp. CCH11-B1]|jgi:iron complex outermembrane receptor protein|uniref:TonB-dependent receptor n=1 Tax=Sphingobium sp. CCH11-B1 TaxID=1768781 RepID=UPI0008352AB6|nr:TonB-dependent receptor [Sphingobium sp. CCH11-B1]
MRRLACLAIAATPFAACAEPEASPGPAIVVTGASLPLPPGAPAYGSVLIERPRLENNASGRIENLLSDVAGFQQFRRSDSRSSNPSNQGATLRALGGNASSRTLVLLDGVPVADPFFGYIPFSALVPDRLSLMRVTRGAGSGAFGSGAVAGTIEMASATRDQLDYVDASAFYGSRDAREISASVSPDLGGGFASLSGRWDKGDGFQTTPRDQRVAATVPAMYDSWSANLRIAAPIGANEEVQFRATLFDDRRTLRFAGADSRSQGQDASIRYLSRGRWQVDALAYIQARNFSNIVISSTSFRKSLDQRNTPSTGIGGKIELRPLTETAHALRFGIDARWSNGVMMEDAYNANLPANPITARRQASGDQLTTGFFIEEDWTPSGPEGRLVLTGGMRADRWAIRNGGFRATNPAGALTADTIFADRADWVVSGRAGALFHLADALALRASAYSGFRLPTLNELYRPFVVFPVTTQANAALKPERLKGAEGGFDVTLDDRLTVSATLFTNRLDHAIANVTIGPNLRQRQNVDAIRAEGAELSGRAKFGPALTLSAAYAYSRSRVSAPGALLDGKRPAQVPRHAASATLDWTRGGATLSATLRYVGRQYEDDLQTDALPDALTIDGFVRLPVARGLSLIARAENLSDSRVITRNAGGSIDLGTPRTLWIGVRYGH